MFSLVVNKFDNSNLEIGIFISSIVYIILHYIIFNMKNDLVQKFKYLFYGIVLVDIIYSIHSLKKSPVEEVPKEIPEVPKEIPKPELMIEPPYLDENITHSQQFVPFTGTDHILPKVNLNTIEKDMKMQAMNDMLQKQKEISEQINKTITEEEVKKLIKEKQPEKQEIIIPDKPEPEKQLNSKQITDENSDSSESDDEIELELSSVKDLETSPKEDDE